MEIFLIRHTSPDIGQGICYGQTDIPLKSTFLTESASVLRQLPDLVDLVYSSPLSRCMQLAKLIGQNDVHTDHRLMELNFGNWEMKEWNQIPKTELDPWMQDFVNVAPPSGESMVDLQTRVLAWWRELDFDQNSKIAIVTHAGVIRILVSLIKAYPLHDAFEKVKVDYGIIFKVDAKLHTVELLSE